MLYLPCLFRRHAYADAICQRVYAPAPCYFHAYAVDATPLQHFAIAIAAERRCLLPPLTPIVSPRALRHCHYLRFVMPAADAASSPLMLGCFHSIFCRALCQTPRDYV